MMHIDNILKVIGNALLKIQGINPMSLARLSEDSDFYYQLGLKCNELEKAISEVEDYYKIEMGEEARQNANTKFWINTILNGEKASTQTSIENQKMRHKI